MVLFEKLTNGRGYSLRRGVLSLLPPKILTRTLDFLPAKSRKNYEAEYKTELDMFPFPSSNSIPFGNNSQQAGMQSFWRSVRPIPISFQGDLYPKY